MKVFVYGTLKQGHGNNTFLEESEFLGSLKLKLPFKLYDLGHFPALIADKGKHTIHGEVYEVDAKTMKALDRLEGYPDFYDKGVMKTKFGKTYFYYIKEKDEYMKLIPTGNWK